MPRGILVKGWLSEIIFIQQERIKVYLRQTESSQCASRYIGEGLSEIIFIQQERIKVYLRHTESGQRASRYISEGLSEITAHVYSCQYSSDSGEEQAKHGEKALTREK